jgi:hypothetical protein
MAAVMLALFLPDSGSLPPWAGIVVGAVVLPVIALRAWRLWRAYQRHKR